LDNVRITTQVLRALTAWPSPLGIFAGNWMLFDV
jgi:hypothetical protein